MQLQQPKFRVDKSNTGAAMDAGSYHVAVDKAAAFTVAAAAAAAALRAWQQAMPTSAESLRPPRQKASGEPDRRRPTTPRAR